MIEKVAMPQLGESVTEGTIASWLKQPGDPVNLYEPMCEVVTDKVNAEVPATVAGTLVEIVASEGTTIAVGDIICVIETASGGETPGRATGDAVADGKAPHEAPNAAAAKTAPETAPTTASNEATGAAAVDRTVVPGAGKKPKMRYSPAVLKLAQENGIDLNVLTGSGRGGRITRKDVLTYMAQREQGAVNAASDRQEETQVAGQEQAVRAEHTPSPQTGVPTSAPAPESVHGQTGHKAPPITTVGTPDKIEGTAAQPLSDGERAIPLTPVRRAIAERMVTSKREAPHAWLTVEADVTALVRLRERLKEPFAAREGIKLTYLPFFIKAVVESLKDYPRLNATWAGDKIVEKREINVSVAVAKEDELYVPVVRRADQLSIFGIAAAVDELVRKTAAGELAVQDIAGGTFTVNNTGTFGSIASAPIINYPQAAIISIESIVKRPVVIGDGIAIRDMVNFCLSFDHRVLDGLIAGRFMQSVKAKMEAYGEQTAIY
ncbi:dihydrolipoamide acetyltransferase family protein [Numidum massiliense]|uniref:dihydrolipoamide acetyltransferase family protein n=1 Tax=Numidum massiliense TaxID=1522315 RepID=UPI0006D53C8A|nr:dihydrolipoamide acetyltransferase family protein [Numidum massiliense]